MNVNKHVQTQKFKLIYSGSQQQPEQTNVCEFFFYSLMNSLVHVVFHTELSIPHYSASSSGKNVTLSGYRLSDLPLFWQISLLTGLSRLVTAANEDLDRGCFCPCERLEVTHEARLAFNLAPPTLTQSCLIK